MSKLTEVMEQEIWKPVPSREGISASSFGRVRLPERCAAMPNGGIRRYNTRPSYGVKTKACRMTRHEYYVLFSKFFGSMKVHRLVCEAFHGPPPFPRAVVIHLDENALNNSPENLKWGTQKENLNMPNFIAYCKSRTGESSPRAKARRKRLSQIPIANARKS